MYACTQLTYIICVHLCVFCWQRIRPTKVKPDDSPLHAKPRRRKTGDTSILVATGPSGSPQTTATSSNGEASSCNDVTSAESPSQPVAAAADSVTKTDGDSDSDDDDVPATGVKIDGINVLYILWMYCESSNLPAVVCSVFL